MSTSLIIMILESGRKIQLYALQRVYKYVLKVSIMPWSHLPKDGALLQENIKRNFPLHIAKSKIPRKGLQDGMLKNIKMCKRGKERTGEHESMSPCFIQPHWNPTKCRMAQCRSKLKFDFSHIKFQYLRTYGGNGTMLKLISRHQCLNVPETEEMSLWNGLSCIGH